MDRADLLILGRPSVAAAGGRVLAVGERDGLDAYRGPETEVLDLGDAAVFPGLRDAHCHLVPTGLAFSRIDCRGLSLPEIRRAVAERAATTPAGAWILGMSFTLDRLGTGRVPTAADLDDVAPDHPVRISSHDLHALWVNTAALRRAGRPADSPSYMTEDEIRIFMDAAGRETAEERALALREALPVFHEHGITEIQDHGRLDDLLTLIELAGEGGLSIRVRFSIRQHDLARYLEIADDLALVPGLLEVNGHKLFLDGALNSRTAWTLEPYEGTEETGHRVYTEAEAMECVAAAAAAGLPSFIHAIGDAAVRQALDLAAAHPGLPHRVEHAQLVHPDDIGRFAALGVMASMQPVHLLTDTPVLPALWGEERARRTFPVRSILATGARVALGSDTPVETLDVMKGVYAAATRRTLDGELLPGEETVPAATALALYLSRPAVEPGAPADLVAFPRDPREVPVEELPGLVPVATVFSGEVVFGG